MEFCAFLVLLLHFRFIFSFEQKSESCCAEVGLIKVMMHHFEARFKKLEDDLAEKDRVSLMEYISSEKNSGYKTFEI